MDTVVNKTSPKFCQLLCLVVLRIAREGWFITVLCCCRLANRASIVGHVISAQKVLTTIVGYVLKYQEPNPERPCIQEVKKGRGEKGERLDGFCKSQLVCTYSFSW